MIEAELLALVDPPLSERQRDLARMTAVADVYVLTNKIRDLLEDRLDAIARAVRTGATTDELRTALLGAERWS